MKKLFNIIALIASIGAFVSCDQIAPKQDKQENEITDEMEPLEPNTLSQAEINEGWVLLFDGKDVRQWRGYNQREFPKKGWEIVDGTLMVVGTGKGEAGGGGDIITVKKFENFELTLDWKVSQGGNSGIFYLAREKKDQPIWQSAPEMQILDNERHPDAKLGKDGNRAAGALYDLIPGNMSLVKPAGEWNRARILVFNGTVVHWMNGETVLEYHFWTDAWKEMVLNSKFKDYPDFLDVAKEGYIGLQDHGDDVWFRNIKIKEL